MDSKTSKWLLAGLRSTFYFLGVIRVELRAWEKVLAPVSNNKLLIVGDPHSLMTIVSSMHQLQLEEEMPSFSQIVSLSGSPLMMRPLPSFVANGVYKEVMTILGFQHLPVAERILALSEMPAAELLQKLPPGLPFLPVLDGCTIKKDTKFSDLASNKAELPENINILIGSCDMDVCKSFHHY